MAGTEFDWKGKRILVTGGAGFLGKQVIQQLCQTGADLDKITILRSRDCDLRTMANCQRAVDQQDVIIHLAAHVGVICTTPQKGLVHNRGNHQSFERHW